MRANAYVYGNSSERSPPEYTGINIADVHRHIFSSPLTRYGMRVTSCMSCVKMMIDRNNEGEDGPRCPRPEFQCHNLTATHRTVHPPRECNVSVGLHGE